MSWLRNLAGQVVNLVSNAVLVLIFTVFLLLGRNPRTKHTGIHAEIDAKISQVLLSTDETVRQQLYGYILTTLHDQAVYLPLSYVRGVIVHKEHLKGVRYGQLKAEIPFALIEKNSPPDID